MSDALDLYLEEMILTKRLFKLYGFDIFSEIIENSFMTFFTIFALISFNLSEVYSAYHFRDNFFLLAFSLMTWPHIFQVLISIWPMYYNRKIFWKIHLEIIDFHKKNADFQILSDCNKTIRLFNKIFGGGCMFFGSAVISYPIFDSIFLSKKKVLGFGVLLPLTDPEENIGYLLNFLFQTSFVITVGFGFTIFLRVYWMFFGHACARIDILKSTVDALQEHITDNENVKQDRTISLKLDEIVQLHVEYLRFMDILENVGKQIIFLLAFTTIIEISLMLLILFSETPWYPAIGGAILGNLILLAICLLGTVIEVKYEQFSQSIYDSEWYLMSLKNQKKCLYILMVSQIRKPLTFWNYDVVTIPTFLKIFKTMYSGFMLLLRSNQ